MEKSHMERSKTAGPKECRSRSSAATSSKKTQVLSAWLLLKSCTSSSQRSCRAVACTSTASRGGSPGDTPSASSLPEFTMPAMTGMAMLNTGMSRKIGTPDTRKFLAPARCMDTRNSFMICTSDTPGLGCSISGVAMPPCTPPRNPRPPPIKASAIFIMKSLPHVWTTTRVSGDSNPPGAFGTCGLMIALCAWPRISAHREPACAKLCTGAPKRRPRTCGQVGCM
mmetsp:Transcript_125151/g.296947  ORF Transcript_125151/g.296947 Transcript_125151/m.296947 type:complete len:225 (+) Transcript_125151:652-1326(+)